MVSMGRRSQYSPELRPGQPGWCRSTCTRTLAVGRDGSVAEKFGARWGLERRLNLLAALSTRRRCGAGVRRGEQDEGTRPGLITSDKARIGAERRRKAFSVRVIQSNASKTVEARRTRSCRSGPTIRWARRSESDPLAARKVDHLRVQ
jgi:hypothetical protein